jgi:hypothetical protein
MIVLYSLSTRGNKGVESRHNQGTDDKKGRSLMLPIHRTFKRYFTSINPAECARKHASESEHRVSNRRQDTPRIHAHVHEKPVRQGSAATWDFTVQKAVQRISINLAGIADICSLPIRDKNKGSILI